MNAGPVPRGQCQYLLFAGGEQGVQLLLERVITDAIVQLGTGLHGVDHVLLMAFGTFSAALLAARKADSGYN